MEDWERDMALSMKLTSTRKKKKYGLVYLAISIKDVPVPYVYTLTTNIMSSNKQLVLTETFIESKYLVLRW